MSNFNIGDEAIIRSSGVSGKVVYIEDGYIELQGKNGATFTVDGPEDLDRPAPKPEPEPEGRESYSSLGSALFSSALQSGNHITAILFAPVSRGPLPDANAGHCEIGGVTIGGHTHFLAALLHNNMGKIMASEGIGEAVGTWDELTDDQKLNYVDMLVPGGGVVDRLRDGKSSPAVVDMTVLSLLGRGFGMAA